VAYLDPAASGLIPTRMRDAMTTAPTNISSLASRPRGSGASTSAGSGSPSLVWWVAEPTRSRFAQTARAGVMPLRRLVKWSGRGADMTLHDSSHGEGVIRGPLAIASAAMLDLAKARMELGMAKTEPPARRWLAASPG
jgi:hypothetical protein